MLEKVLVAVDRSDHSEKTLSAARELAEKAGSEIRVLHVQELGWGARIGEVPLEEHDEAKQIVHDALTALEQDGISATGVLRSALTHRIAGEIAAEAQESGCTVVVMGFRGASGHDGGLIGSTANRVIHSTDIPVFVVT